MWEVKGFEEKYVTQKKKEISFFLARELKRKERGLITMSFHRN